MLNLLAWIVIILNEFRSIITSEKPSANIGDDKNLQETCKETQNDATVLMIQSQKKPVKLQHSKIVTYVDAPLALNRNCKLKINLKWKKPFCAQKEDTQYTSNVKMDSELQSHDSVDLQNQTSPDFIKKEDLGRSTSCYPESGRSTAKLQAGQFDDKHFTPVQFESPKTQYQDFDVIMKKRKLHTDTMQNVGDTFGMLGHRNTKITGHSSKHTISERWRKVQIAVKRKEFMKMNK